MAVRKIRKLSTMASCACLLLVVPVLEGCSNVGPGLPNHPMDCAIGVPWADCLPGTPGYRGPTAQETQAKWQAVGEKVRAATAECREKRLAKEIKGFKASAECSNPQIIAAYQEAQYQYMDLVFVAAAARVAGSENVDKGKITEAEYNLQLAELNSRIVAEEERRNLAKTNVQAAQMQARAAQM